MESRGRIGLLLAAGGLVVITIDPRSGDSDSIPIDDTVQWRPKGEPEISNKRECLRMEVFKSRLIIPKLNDTQKFGISNRSFLCYK